MSHQHQHDINAVGKRNAMYAHLGPDTIDALHDEHRVRLLSRHTRRHRDHEWIDRHDDDITR